VKKSVTAADITGQKTARDLRLHDNEVKPLIVKY